MPRDGRAATASQRRPTGTSVEQAGLGRCPPCHRRHLRRRPVTQAGRSPGLRHHLAVMSHAGSGPASGSDGHLVRGQSPAAPSVGPSWRRSARRADTNGDDSRCSTASLSRARLSQTFCPLRRLHDDCGIAKVGVQSTPDTGVTVSGAWTRPQRSGLRATGEVKLRGPSPLFSERPRTRDTHAPGRAGSPGPSCPAAASHRHGLPESSRGPAMGRGGAQVGTRAGRRRWGPLPSVAGCSSSSASAQSSDTWALERCAPVRAAATPRSGRVCGSSSSSRCSSCRSPGGDADTSRSAASAVPPSRFEHGRPESGRRPQAFLCASPTTIRPA